VVAAGTFSSCANRKMWRSETIAGRDGFFAPQSGHS